MTAGYSGTPLVKKLGLKPGMACAALEAPADYPDLLEDSPEELVWKDPSASDLDFVHLFVRDGEGLGSDWPSSGSGLPGTG